MTAITGIEVHMTDHPRPYSRMTREALTMMGGLIRLARKQRKMSEADLSARVGIARSTLQLIEKGHPKVEIGLVFEAATLVGVPLFVDEPSRLAPEISRINDKLALLPQSVRRPRSEVKDDF
ncbi:XRE family transcriptional regulator [Sphingobium sp. TKS]|nr:XRE family transcriptional regulator [Sphingobium sp. TKS]